jgi:hypothetical protein
LLSHMISRAFVGFLRDEFPRLHAVIEVPISGFADGKPIHLRHTLLVGEPGGVQAGAGGGSPAGAASDGPLCGLSSLNDAQQTHFNFGRRR